ncbi:MAG TPA: CbiX/SirB N-terminal domain-containing protein, partial [Jatrophihabitans sp.]|nr:CbiX/SirB N-terminal domain-containing protein [Jatrophihabitans sp.]
MAATLLAVAHGTADPAGLAEIGRLVELVRAHRPGATVELGWLERADPPAGRLLDRLAGAVVIVPVLLSTGFHVKVDITRLAA